MHSKVKFTTTKNQRLIGALLRKNLHAMYGKKICNSKINNNFERHVL